MNKIEVHVTDEIIYKCFRKFETATWRRADFKINPIELAIKRALKGQFVHTVNAGNVDLYNPVAAIYMAKNLWTMHNFQLLPEDAKEKVNTWERVSKSSMSLYQGAKIISPFSFIIQEPEWTFGLWTKAYYKYIREVNPNAIRWEKIMAQIEEAGKYGDKIIKKN